jgi:hypothetical protein
MQAIGRPCLTPADHLSTEFKKRMAPHLQAALAGPMAIACLSSYTNTFLMSLASGMLTGQALGDPGAVRQADQQTHGSTAPAATASTNSSAAPDDGCDLNSPVEGNRHAAIPGQRRKFERALDYFWMGIAANLMPGAQRMRAPLQRRLRFPLGGRGGMDM